MAAPDYEKQLQKVNKEIESKKKQKREILQKWTNEQKETDKSILPKLGAVIQMYLKRHLTEADVQNLYAFLYGQEHRGTAHFFTDFMNDESYRTQALKGPEYKDMPEYIPASNGRKKSNKGSNTQKPKKDDINDSKA